MQVCEEEEERMSVMSKPILGGTNRINEKSEYFFPVAEGYHAVRYVDDSHLLQSMFSFSKKNHASELESRKAGVSLHQRFGRDLVCKTYQLFSCIFAFMWKSFRKKMPFRTSQCKLS